MRTKTDACAKVGITARSGGLPKGCRGSFWGPNPEAMELKALFSFFNYLEALEVV